MFTCVPPTNLRHRFTHIGIDTRGFVTLTSRKRHDLGIEYDPVLDRIMLRTRAKPGSVRGRRTFKAVSSGPEVGFRLTGATWDDGSQAVLDSRGLLHLRSSDKSLPEVSIVLTDGELAGWCSDGRLWGSSYFTGQRDGASRRGVFSTVIKKFAERLR